MQSPPVYATSEPRYSNMENQAHSWFSVKYFKYRKAHNISFITFKLTLEWKVSCLPQIIHLQLCPWIPIYSFMASGSSCQRPTIAGQFPSRFDNVVSVMYAFLGLALIEEVSHLQQECCGHERYAFLCYLVAAAAVHQYPMRAGSPDEIGKCKIQFLGQFLWFLRHHLLLTLRY